MSEYYAHSLEERPKEEWQPLEEHLKNAADLAAKFAEPFGGQEWARIAGLWHDVGKGTLVWQAFLRHANGVEDKFKEFYKGHPTHADNGAQNLSQKSAQAGKLLAYLVSGHHGGLPNWDSSFESSLKSRLLKKQKELQIAIPKPQFPELLPITLESHSLGYQFQFFARMLFSCLVDADYLDTEAALDKERAGWRSKHSNLQERHASFWNAFNQIRDNADSSTRINRQRETVLQDCLSMTKKKPGIFSLTVPTGGGKTLASMAFALEHARIHGKKRIIYVIPFTSIIEQNAKVFRNVLGEEAILEHHCNFIPDSADWKTRLASENWDAPIVVTTNVQFFNSFYANKPSKCRKLHNVANSVVIFDEVQAIPVTKLKPCLEVIKELSLNYGVVPVLCTATQPAFKHSDEFPSGLKDVVEIIQDVPKLFDNLRRTRESFIGKVDHAFLAERLADQNQVLCIVNTRQQALDVFDSLPESAENIHLSALMHPSHRTRKLDEVRERLDKGMSCRVISTQLIEAGVDIDFPCLYRVVTGIDSIAQAAGRCNRNGLSDKPRDVFIFEFPEEKSCYHFRMAAQSARKLFGRYTGRLTDPECVRDYFADFFWKNSHQMDADMIVEQCLNSETLDIQFKDIAQFQMIKSATIPIIIAIEKAAGKLVDALEHAEHKGGILRKLQQYTVQVYQHQFNELREWLESPIPGVYVLKSKNIYSDETGLICQPPQGKAFFG